MEKSAFEIYLDASVQRFRTDLLAAFDGRLDRLDRPSSNALTTSTDDHADHTPSLPRIHEELFALPFESEDASSTNSASVQALKSLKSSKSRRTGSFDSTVQKEPAAGHRLQLRLGAFQVKKADTITASQLHDAVEALGLTRYSVQDMEDFLRQMATYISLSFEESAATTGMANATTRLTPVWTWPLEDACVSPFSPSQTPFTSEGIRTYDTKFTRNNVAHPSAVPVKALKDLFLTDAHSVLRRKIFDNKGYKQFQAMQEILLAGDANRLVAELTFVRINDLAAPPDEAAHPLAFLEHVITFVIIANAVCLGFMADPRYGDWNGWQFVELFFAVFLLIEILVRSYAEGCSLYWCGAERWWNFFDMTLASLSWIDLLISQLESQSSELFVASFLRICRLIRLVRVMRIFRLKAFKELRLMIKGLLAGLWTLLLSFTLLFSVLYLIAGFTTVAIGGENPKTAALGLRDQFLTIPDSMFTAFRCFTGDCNSDQGEPIASLLFHEYKLPFMICFVISYMLVAMGIFNVILAVYVDITMKAAKETEALTAEQHARESIRIARTTRELLKKFAAFQKTFQNDSNEPVSESSMGDLNFMDEEIKEDLSITKECFLMVIQDRTVQILMDQLDLPPDRANLFEIIDADGSGTLHVGELVHGLLQIRGEVKKSDTVAPLLATKAVQQMAQDNGEETKKMFAKLELHINEQLKGIQKQLGLLPKSLSANPMSRTAQV